MLQKRAQGGIRDGRMQRQRLQRLRQRRVALQRDQPLRQPGVVGMFDQVVAQLALLHLRRGGEDGFQVAMLDDQLGGGLGPDARYARHVVDAVAHQRQHIAQLLGADAELLDDIGFAQPPVVHRVEHVEAAILDQLHQVLVARHDRDLPALLQCGAGVAGDQVVGLQPHLLDAGQREGAGGVADHGKLGHQIGRGRGPVRLILVVHVVAEGLGRLVEDHRHMGRPVGGVDLVHQLPQHGGIAIDRPDRLAMLVRQRRQAVIGAKDIAGAVDEIEMGHDARGLADAAEGKQPLMLAVFRGCGGWVTLWKRKLTLTYRCPKEVRR